MTVGFSKGHILGRHTVTGVTTRTPGGGQPVTLLPSGPDSVAASDKTFKFQLFTLQRGNVVELQGSVNARFREAGAPRRRD